MVALGESIGVDEATLPAVTELTHQWEQTLSVPAPRGCHTLVALHGREISGFASCAPVGPSEPIRGRGESIPGGIEVLNLWVDPAFTRSGHASRLLAAIVDVTAAPTLHVWVAAGDETRIRFFESAGFAPAGLRRAHRMGAGAGDLLVEHLWWATRH